MLCNLCTCRSLEMIDESEKHYRDIVDILQVCRITHLQVDLLGVSFLLVQYI